MTRDLPPRLPPLVSTTWLAERLGAPGLVVIDASWYMPAMQRDADAEYLAAHVPGAVRVDLEAVSDAASPLPHMLPDAAAFAAHLGALGVGDDDAVVVYDGSRANMTAPRVWWMLRTFGHARAAVLDGGLGKWRAEGRPLESGAPPPRPPARFTARLDATRVRDLEAMRANLESHAAQVVDARAAERFAGAVSEPRPGLRSGHIPGSASLPYGELVAPDGTVLPPEALRERFERAGIDLGRPVVATCGSGVTACALVLGLAVLGHEEAAVYDGSWTEWGGRPEVPVETSTRP